MPTAPSPTVTHLINFVALIPSLLFVPTRQSKLSLPVGSVRREKGPGEEKTARDRLERIVARRRAVTRIEWGRGLVLEAKGRL